MPRNPSRPDGVPTSSRLEEALLQLHRAERGQFGCTGLGRLSPFVPAVVRHRSTSAATRLAGLVPHCAAGPPPGLHPPVARC
eukprot:COSAG02_NODE_2766_length_8067_cov_6.245733_8_plen_82_part_00